MGKNERQLKYHDKKRHGGKREGMLKAAAQKFKSDNMIFATFYKCSRCSMYGSSFQVVAHHATGNNQDHDEQVLLCRSCHAKEHGQIGRLNFKDVSKAQIEAAIEKCWGLDEVCSELSISRATLYKKRKDYGLEDRTKMRGRKRS